MTEKEHYSNCIRLQGGFLWFCDYYFLDIHSCIAEEIFQNANLKVRILHRFVHPEKAYCIYRCRIRKKDEKLFDRCMDELERKMLLLGHTDYCEFGRELIRKVVDYNRKI